VVLTSSAAAIVNPDKEPNYTFTEADWASIALDTAIKNRDAGIDTPAAVLYPASKTASDRLVWRFREEKKVCSLFLTLLHQESCF
jgi:nucleoside-diphosphate-sugar epimerase